MNRLRDFISKRMNSLFLMGLALTLGLIARSNAIAQHDHPSPPVGSAAASDDHDHAAHAAAGHDDHDEGFEEHAEDDHAGHEQEGCEHGHEEEEDHSGHAHEEEGLRLTAEQRERFGIALAEASPGSLRNEVTLPGEILFNGDKVVHMVPPVPGIAREVLKTVGDTVKAGDVLAIIDSPDLASAKLDYIAAVTEVGCCQFELPRAQAIHDNSTRMLQLLESSPSAEQLRESLAGEMGGYGSRLISAYADYVQTGKAYERERVLMGKEISSESDFLAAESAFKRAQANYFGTRDSVAFEVRQELLEAARDRQLAELQARTAEQMLGVLGLSEAQISELATPGADSPVSAPEVAHECPDPNCKDCLQHSVVKDERNAAATTTDQKELGWYDIRAPIDGVVVQRHLTRGERVGEDADIFTIADVNSVWVDLTVYSKDLTAVRKGQEVLVRLDHSGAQARGEVAMVTPFVDEATRSATARIVLDNGNGEWMPGTFVTGFISTSEENLPVVVPRNAVQSIEGRDVVFVEHDGAFEPTPVRVGRSDRAGVDIIAGLEPGAHYVSEGAFHLKATLITSNLDSHAGHGH